MAGTCSIAQQPIDRREPGPSRLRVMIVDHHCDAADSTGLLVKLWGHEPYVCYSPNQALQSAGECRPHIVLLDLGLPEMDGYQLADWFRSHDPKRQMVLVALTGFGRETDRQRSAEAGFDLHLVKPVDPRRLQDVLAQQAALV